MRVYLIYECGEFSGDIFSSEVKARKEITDIMVKHLIDATEQGEEPFLKLNDFTISEVEVK
jgi:hypothetical protein